MADSDSVDSVDSVECPHCRKLFAARDEHFGRRVRCRGCGQVFQVPPRIDAPPVLVDAGPPRSTARRATAIPPTPAHKTSGVKRAMLVMVVLWALTIAVIFVFCVLNSTTGYTRLANGDYWSRRGDVASYGELVLESLFAAGFLSFVATAIYATICGALFVVHFATRPDPPPR